MPDHSIFRLRNHVLMAALAAAFPVVSYAAGAAKVDFVVGRVTAIGVTGAVRDLAKGTELDSGDSVVTGDGGRAQLRFSDGAMVSLQPGSEFKIDSYRYSGREDKDDKSFLSLLKGGLRTITGLVGRSNKDSYRVTTNVATIGIRGTEFTVAYIGANAVAVSTGEGLIEVCNSVGCAVIPAGSSATVSGPNTEIRRSEVKPRLDPAQPSGETKPVFSTSDARTVEGGVDIQSLTGITAPVSVMIPLVSGSGYAVAYAGHDVTFSNPGSPVIGMMSPADTVFSATNELKSFTDGSSTYAASTVAGAFSADGVLGWGRWSSGSGPFSTSSLIDFHYVTGTPTPAGDLTALGGINADYTYNLIGYTLPTAQDGTVGQAPSGTLTANFRNFPSNSTVSVNLSVPIGGSTFSIVGSQTFTCASMSPTFSITTACATVNGFFAGANASHAGITYSLDSGLPMGYVSGAAALKR